MIMYFTMDYSHVRPDLWVDRPGVPTMIVASNFLAHDDRTLRHRTPPSQLRPLFRDCGGFSFAIKGIDFPFSEDRYVDWGRSGPTDYMATMDYPCEPAIAADDAAIADRQIRTLDHAVSLLKYQEAWEWLPVLQGRSVAHYVRHAAMYREAGAVRPYMGIGSLCRRTSVAEIAEVISALSRELPDSKFHLFGVKSLIFSRHDALPAATRSADSGAFGGLFGHGRTPYQAARKRGLSQDQYEIWEALPRYRDKIHKSLAGPKQQRLW